MDRKGFLGMLGLGAIAAKLGGGTVAQAAAVSPEPLSFPDRPVVPRYSGSPETFTYSCEFAEITGTGNVTFVGQVT